MIRWFIILLETAALIFVLFEEEKFNQLLERLLNAIPSSTELKLWVLKGLGFGAGIITLILGAILIVVTLRYFIPFIGTVFNKESLIEKWEEEFIKAKQAEINEIEKLKQEAQKREQELRQQITHYQHLSHQLKRKEVELEIEFQQKRESYLQELSGLQRKNKELQARIKRLKEQLKSCREKLKKEFRRKNWVGEE